MRALAAAALVPLAACSDGPPEGVPVGEAAPPETFAGDPFASDPPDGPRRAATDSSDRLELPPLPGDSLRGDTLGLGPAEPDSLAAPDAPAPPDVAPPDFAPAWRAFLDGRDLAASPDVARVAARALAPPFEPAVRDASPRAFQRDGARRTATVRVGFDAAGAVVPQDEAVRDSTLRLVFDLVDGAYRLVDATLSE